MSEIVYKHRETGELKKEKVYGIIFLEAVYGTNVFAKLFSLLVLPLISHVPLFSQLYGKRQKSKKSREKIAPFVKAYGVDVSEFEKPLSRFVSFNDFFIRKLKPESRPITPGDKVAILPADGRYLVFPKLSESEGFYVKNKKFDLRRLLQDEFLFELYKRGSLVIARLCPTDYHRFHFPFECLPSKPKLINGPLYSVNPIALREHINILNENKRMFTELQTKNFGKVLYIEVGATCVGSIQNTFQPNTPYKKGAEKGYFEFGGSCLLLLFQPNTITFDLDLVEASAQHIETRAKFGTRLGSCK